MRLLRLAGVVPQSRVRWEEAPVGGLTAMSLRLSSSIRGVGFVIISLFFLVPMFRIVFGGLREVLTFEQVTGEVTAYQSPDQSRAIGADRSGRIDYSYVVEGTVLNGSFPPRDQLNMPRAPYRTLNRSHHPGETVTVFHCPADPKKSTLEPRIEPGAFPIITFVLPFCLVGWVYLLKPAWLVANDDEERASRSPGKTALVLYLLASGVAMVAMFFVMGVVTWQVAVLLGSLLPTIIIPGVLILVIRWTRFSRSAPEIAGKAEDRRVNRRQAALIAFACIFWWGAVGVFLVDDVVFWIQCAHGTATYQAAQGAVLCSVVTEHPILKGRSACKLHVRYSYEVEGQTYVGDRVHFASRHWLIGRESAERQRRSYAPGTAVRVWYDPASPEHAVLDMSVPNYRWLLTVLLVPSVVIGAALVVKLVFAARELTIRSGPGSRAVEVRGIDVQT